MTAMKNGDLSLNTKDLQLLETCLHHYMLTGKPGVEEACDISEMLDDVDECTKIQRQRSKSLGCNKMTVKKLHEALYKLIANGHGDNEVVIFVNREFSDIKVICRDVGNDVVLIGDDIETAGEYINA